MGTETVSVLIPTYRRPSLLARAIKSVQAQHWRDLWIVVYDNASGDDTGAIVSALGRNDPRIIYRCHAANIGAAANFRHAIAGVETPFFSMLSDDDVLLPSCLAHAVRGLREYPAAMAWSGIVISANDDEVIGLRPWPPWPAGFISRRSACLRVACDNRPETTGMVFRRTVITERFLGNRPNFMAADVGWVLEAAKLGGIGHTPEPSAVFYVHPGSISSGGGASCSRAIAIYWPSVRHLMDQFLECCPLSSEDASNLLSALRWNYGISNFRRLAFLSFRQRDLPSMADCCAILSELGDNDFLFYFNLLRTRPAASIRYRMYIRGQIARLRSLPSRMRMRRRIAVLSTLARCHLGVRS